MALIIVKTGDEQLVGHNVVCALRESLATCGSALLLVPSFDKATQAQRELAAIEGLSLGVTVTTPQAWVKDQWQLWGDGRLLADQSVLTVLAYQVLRSAAPGRRGPLSPLPGTVSVVSKLAYKFFPWLPLNEYGEPNEEICASAGLTNAEVCLLRMACTTQQKLHAYGYLSIAEASCALPTIVASKATLSHVVVAGFSSMEKIEQELLLALSQATQVTYISLEQAGVAFEQARSLSNTLLCKAGATARVMDANRTNSLPTRSSELQKLLDALFENTHIDPTPNTPVELLLPAGPIAEAEAITQYVASYASHVQATPDTTVVVVPNAHKAWRELAPKLAERSISARTQWSQPMAENAHAQAFMGFVSEVVRLKELAQTWPAPTQGLEGPLPQLGNMDWWPPRAIIDFLLDDMSHMPASKTWRLDAQWRGNRLLTPAQVLEELQSERITSKPVARATFELLRGRVGSAAAKLMTPYRSQSLSNNNSAQEICTVLQAVIQTAGTLHKLGISHSPNDSSTWPLSEVCTLLSWALGSTSVVARQATHSSPTQPQVLVLQASQAAQLPPGSANTVILCGLTSVEQPIESKEDVLQALLEQLGIEPRANSLAKARSEFRSLLSIARSKVVLERALADSEGKATYPSVMLSELFATYGASASASPSKLPFTHELRSERDLIENLSQQGEPVRCAETCTMSAAGHLTEASQQLVFALPPGKKSTLDNLPVLSASQIETYLDCPYKWFSLRRLRLGSVDAGHTGLEMGSFAHHVLEVTHREILARALESKTGHPVAEAEINSMLEENPCRHIPDSRIHEGNLALAQSTLELEFDLYREAMCRQAKGRPSQQLLIAHDSADRSQERQLKKDLCSSLAYQTRILEGFEPRFFEWSFGRHEPVEYAGAYFVGTADRIDVNPHGMAVIIDYKHKSPAGFANEYDALQDGVLEGEQLPTRVQSLIYGQIVRRAFQNKLNVVGSVYLSTRSPHALAGVCNQNVADMVFGKLTSKRLPRVSVPPNETGNPGMDDLLDRTEELIAEQVRLMLAGHMEANPRNQHSCDFCPVMQCERRMAQ